MNVLFLTILAFGLNLGDFAGFSREWQAYRSPTQCLRYDYDRSGIVDLYDLDLFLDGWIMSATLTVTGLESPFDTLNGIYTESGESNGRPKYVFGEDAYIEWSGTAWTLVDAQSNIWTGNDGTYPDGDFIANEETDATGTATVSGYETLTGDSSMSYAARTIVIPPRVGDGMETNLAVILKDRATGDLVNGATGACSASVTVAQAAIVYAAAAAAGKWTTHTLGGDAIVAIPALSKGRNYILACYDSNTFTNYGTLGAPTRQAGYDPEFGRAFNESVPTNNRNQIKQ